MKTIALRFTNSFSPECGTIESHQTLINQYGYFWYGKLGAKVSSSIVNTILKNDNPRILLIHSGATQRFWAFIDRIEYSIPPLLEIPEYYRDRAIEFKTWFRVRSFIIAPKDILSHCVVASSGVSLSHASRHSMSPYFIIETDCYDS